MNKLIYCLATFFVFTHTDAQWGWTFASLQNGGKGSNRMLNVFIRFLHINSNKNSKYIFILHIFKIVGYVTSIVVQILDASIWTTITIKIVV